MACFQDHKSKRRIHEASKDGKVTWCHVIQGSVEWARSRQGKINTTSVEEQPGIANEVLGGDALPPLPPLLEQFKIIIVNFKEYNLIGQILNLLFKDHQFESYKSQDH
jgi:hypothetical protein